MPAAPDEFPRPLHSLDEARAHMRWALEPGEFQLAVFGRDLDVGLLAGLGGHAQVTFEPREITVLAPAETLRPLLEGRPEARVARDLAWIRFEASMDWELVGFLALVCGRMAAAGVPLGAVCSFDRDHLFVARRHLDSARRVLDDLFPGRELR